MQCARLNSIAIVLALAAGFTGCGELAQLTGRTFHEKCGWKAKEFFDDPQVVALCHAIEANDLKEIDRLIAAGANVNAKGKDNMTPLLWAFPDNKLQRFTRLLEHGADPNVIIQSDMNTHGSYFGRGESVTHMACKTTFPGYFEAVFAHRGDPKLITNKIITGQTTIHAVITGGGPNKKERVRFLIDHGADLNHMNGAWTTPVMQAVSWGGQYNIALMLLEAGADWRIYVPKSNTRLIHIVATEEDPTAGTPVTATTRQSRKSIWTPEQAADYEKLVQWLEDHGESIEQARADSQRWQLWNTTPAEFRRKMDAEIAERVAREAGEKAATEEE
jgi:ankyrin repeat protein